MQVTKSAYNICFCWLSAEFELRRRQRLSVSPFLVVRWRPVTDSALSGSFPSPVPTPSFPFRAAGKRAACQAARGSRAVTANVTKPAAHHCPNSLSPAVIGCKGSPNLARRGPLGGTAMSSTQISEMNCVPNFEAASGTETADQKLMLLAGEQEPWSVWFVYATWK